MWLPQQTDKKHGVNSLVTAIEKAIFSQHLKIGERLPPQRILAYKLNVNPTTVSRAYQRAAQKGLVGGQIGRGTYVLAQSNAALFSQVLSEREEGVIDLSINKLPCDDTILAINKAVEHANYYRDTAQYYEYIDQALIARYQLAVAQWLERSRDIHFQSEQILAIPSCQYAIHFIFKQCLTPGAVIIVEQFTAPGIIAAAKEYGLRLFTCKCDDQGLIPESLDSIITQTNAKLLITIPSNQSPMGTTLSTQRRQALAKVIVKRDLLTIEEDIYGMFATPSPLAKYAPQHTLLVSGFSKCLSGGHKVSFIATAHPVLKKLQNNIIETLWLISSSSASHIVTALEHQFIEQAIAHVNKNNIRKNRLINSIMSLSVTHTNPHHWLPCSHSFVQQAADHGIKLAHQENFAVTQDQLPLQHYRLSVHSVSEEHLKSAAMTLAKLRNTQDS